MNTVQNWKALLINSPVNIPPVISCIAVTSSKPVQTFNRTSLAGKRQPPENYPLTSTITAGYT
jgi:hypothetical protein